MISHMPFQGIHSGRKDNLWRLLFCSFATSKEQTFGHGKHLPQLFILGSGDGRSLEDPESRTSAKYFYSSMTVSHYMKVLKHRPNQFKVVDQVKKRRNVDLRAVTPACGSSEGQREWRSAELLQRSDKVGRFAIESNVRVAREHLFWLVTKGFSGSSIGICVLPSRTKNKLLGNSTHVRTITWRLDFWAGMGKATLNYVRLEDNCWRYVGDWEMIIEFDCSKGFVLLFTPCKPHGSCRSKWD